MIGMVFRNQFLDAGTLHTKGTASGFEGMVVLVVGEESPAASIFKCLSINNIHLDSGCCEL